jgi:hypothetical protein
MRVDYESVELTLSLDDSGVRAVCDVMPSVRRRAELVAVLSWCLVCSCIILQHVSLTSMMSRYRRNVPSIRRRRHLWVVQVELVGEVVLGGHGLGEFAGNVDSGVLRHFERCMSVCVYVCDCFEERNADADANR